MDNQVNESNRSNGSNELNTCEKRKYDEISNSDNNDNNDNNDSIDSIMINNNTKKLKINVNDFMCPVTKQIFNRPVVADDGFTYEKWAIDRILSDTKQSPITREQLTKYCESKLISKHKDDFLNDNPEFKNLQFDKMNYSFIENISSISKLLDNKNFKELCEYAEIHLNHEFNVVPFIKKISMSNINMEHFSMILDNSIDLNVKDNYKKLPIYHICLHGSYDMILCALDKNTNIYNIDENENSIVHILFKQLNKLTLENKQMLLEYLINNKMLNVAYENIQKYSIMKTILSNCDNFINNILDKITNVKLVNILFNFDMIADLLLNQSCDSINKILIKHDEILNLHGNNDVVMLYKQIDKDCPEKYKSKLCEFYWCISNLDDNVIISINDKKQIQLKLIDIFITKINVINIDSEMYSYIHELNQKFYKRNTDIIMREWNKKLLQNAENANNIDNVSNSSEINEVC